MQNVGPYENPYGLENHGIEDAGTVYWNLPPARLYEQAIRRNEGVLAADGPLVTRTGQHTGRAPNDRYLVREPGSEANIWWGKVNQSVDPGQFDGLYKKVRDYYRGRDLFVFDGYAGADAEFRMPVRVVSEYAWHSLFARNMFVREPDGEKLRSLIPEFTVLAAPGCQAKPAADGTRAGTFVAINLAKRLVVIGGTQYAGEIKKSIFTVMNYMLPERGVLPMHCSGNYGTDPQDAALFFGLSGTGKTTLSSDTDRILIGDDEHGWGDGGVFNFEGGCYAKVIRLSREGEPDIYATTERFGTILENVAFSYETRELDLDDASITENTRASYPLSSLGNVDLGGTMGHPKNVIFLTCDAFGVLPPISRLTEAQAMYHFLSGYTAKVAGTEEGVVEPSATFSTCFGAPFMPRHPGVYADLLGKKIQQHGAAVWLINTGWTGGPYGVGSRIALSLTRKMVRGVLSGELAGVDTVADPVFGLQVPQAIAGVPEEVLRPRQSWTDPAAYDGRAAKLAEMFADNFRQFEDGVSEEVRVAGPALVTG